MKERIIETMAAVFEVPAESLNASSDVNSVEKWDSLQHMNLVFAIEEEFGVSLPDDAIVDMTSVEKIEATLKACLEQ